MSDQTNRPRSVVPLPRLTVNLSEEEATNLAHAADGLEVSVPEMLALLAARVYVWNNGIANDIGVTFALGDA
ncbi:hypothetical protein [Nonomuraea sp. NPDC049504]|jgi:hypothetical protein|uniref:hypothetical protein n=1 Tax=Nonomuraea sp. NPDC049504 TaxID=3154729 RepID=UPI003425D3D6